MFELVLSLIETARSLHWLEGTDLAVVQHK